MKVKIYVSESNQLLLQVDKEQEYTVPFPESGKHPRLICEFIEEILNKYHEKEDFVFLTHSSVVINVLVDWVEKKEFYTKDDLTVTVLREDGDTQVATLSDDYCLVNWPLGFLSNY